MDEGCSEGHQHQPCPTSLHLLDVPAVRGGLGHDHAEGVQDESRQPQQLHAVADESRGNDVVHKEGALVGQEDAPGDPGKGCELRPRRASFPSRVDRR